MRALSFWSCVCGIVATLSCILFFSLDHGIYNMCQPRPFVRFMLKFSSFLWYSLPFVGVPLALFAQKGHRRNLAMILNVVVLAFFVLSQLSVSIDACL